MRYLVTGGAGFIGSNFVRMLLAQRPDVEVVNLDLLTYAGNASTVADLPSERHTLVQGDIADRDAVEAAMDGCEVVVNFAAESHVDRSILDSSPFVRTNIAGVQVLLDVARTQSVRRFLHIGTDEVYGSIAEGSFTEGDPLEPNSPYAASKAAADLLCRAYFVTHGVPVIVTRSSNNYGPYQFPEKVLPVFITNLMNGANIPLYGDGANVRDWTFVEDNCRGLLTVLDHGTEGEIYNLGAHNEVPNVEMAHRLLEMFGVGEEKIDHVPDRPGHDLRYSIDTAKVRALGWAPGVPLDEGLERTVVWFRENEDWWRPLKERAAQGALPSTITAQRG